MGRLLSAILLLLICSPLSASTPSCEVLTAAAEREHGLPTNLLTAIAHTESGRRFSGSVIRAWPWTSNIRGEGHYYAARDVALAHLEEALSKGIKSFDVGCMQLNYRWHAHKFTSLATMMEPARNVDYAARYLKELWSETGSWELATKYYHSRDAERGRSYLSRVRNARARISLEPPVAFEAKQHVVPVVPSNTGFRWTTVDGRFPSREPMVKLDKATPYWMHPSLGAGAAPLMP